MRKYKVMIGYRDFISIDETELEKALTAFATGQGAIFNQGAVDRISAILPDYHAMMGWNPSYTLQPEDWAQIRSSEVCRDANRLMEGTRMRVLGQSQQNPQVGDGVKRLAKGMKA
jgi:hypothetical protein